MKERCPSGSAPAFLRRRRGRPDRIVGSPGGPGVLPGIGRVPHGRPDRPGANGALCMSGSHVLPEPAALLSPQALPSSLPSPCFARARRCPPSSASLSLKRFSLPQALLSPSSASLSLKRFSLPQALTRRAPPCFGLGPASEWLLPRARPLCAVSSALLALIRAPRVRPGRPKTAFACGVPGALRGTWVSPTRFDEMNDPCPRNVLI
jgi:hypothetical protein